MGEPVKPIHTRVYEFALWPFDSTSDLADYSEWLTDLVRQAAQVEPSATLSFNIPGPRGTEPPIRLDELRERVDEFPLDKVFEASLEVRTDDLSLTLALNDHVLGSRESLVTVVGTDKDTVNRIRSKVKEEGDARIESERRRKEEAEAKARADADFKRQEAALGIGDVSQAIFEAEAQRERERSQRKRPSRPKQPRASTPQAIPGPPKKSLARRVYDSPYTVQIVGGIVATVVAALIVAMILSN